MTKTFDLLRYFLINVRVFTNTFAFSVTVPSKLCLESQYENQNKYK